MHSYGREISREGGQSESRDGVGVEESLVLRWTQQLAAGLEVGSESFFFLRMCLWWSLCTLCLLACQVRVTVGGSGFCCCVCATSFER